MECLWLEDGRLERRRVALAELPEGEARIELLLAGVCGTDLALLDGYYPFVGIPGHEFVGRVVDCPLNPQWIGKRVVGDINASCGQCETCLTGNESHCARRTVLGIVGRNGVFAESFALPLRNLYPVPAGVSDEAAVFAEPLAAACEILEQVTLGAGRRVLLIGAGRLGQLVARVLACTGCDLAVLAKYENQRNSLERLGIGCISMEDAGQRLWDVVVEATGNPDGLRAALGAVRPRGTIILKSTYRGQISLDMSSIVVDEITLVGSRCGPIKRALELLEGGIVDPRDLIAGTFSLEHGAEALGQAALPGMMKMLILGPKKQRR